MLTRRLRKVASRKRQYVVFQLDAQSWALPAEALLGIGQLQHVTRLPGDCPFNLGIVLHEGRLFPLLDLQGLLGSAPAKPELPQGLALFLRSAEYPFAFPVHELPSLIAVDGELASKAAGVQLLDPQHVVQRVLSWPTTTLGGIARGAIDGHR